MNALSSVARRRRRLVTRALPMVLVAAGAFAAGVVVATGSSGASAPRAFAAAWSDQDFATMYAQLAPDVARRFPLATFTDAYDDAQRLATVVSVETGDVREETVGGREVAVVRVQLATHAFGTLGGDLRLPLADGRVEWDPSLVFPGLARGERLGRRMKLPTRAPILAADGTPLAEGPATARSSPLGSAAADVAGQLGTPPPERAAELERLGFPPATPIGTNGLELAFDRRLAGQPGGELLALAPSGRPQAGAGRVLASSDPVPGKPVRTTIAPGLQQAAVSALAGQFGGVAVLDARHGSVLALAGIAYSAPQPPGSTFKIVTTTAALEAKVVKLDDVFPVVSSVNVGGREIANAHEELCGGTFVESFAHSCNSVFAPLGPKIGSERLVDTAERFGFNAPPSLFDDRALAALDPPASTIPTSIPTDLDLAVSAIGQGQVQATPLELASAAQTIANRGVREPTSIVRDRELRPSAAPVRVTSADVASTVRDLMIEVVNAGTGTAAQLPGIQVAGKTGTAELGPTALEPGQKLGPGEVPEQKVDAWFTAFAPAADPSLVAAAMIVDAPGDGGTIAAPIVRQVLATGLGVG